MTILVDIRDEMAGGQPKGSLGLPYVQPDSECRTPGSRRTSQKDIWRVNQGGGRNLMLTVASTARFLLPLPSGVKRSDGGRRNDSFWQRP